jgi:hypothetical protein
MPVHNGVVILKNKNSRDGLAIQDPPGFIPVMLLDHGVGLSSGKPP